MAEVALSKTDPYCQGQIARDEGKGQEYNPYISVDRQDDYHAWSAGWLQEDRYIRGIDLRVCV